MVTISVIIPFHKGLQELSNACISVDNQIIDKNYNLEICLGNDSKYDNDEVLENLKYHYEVKTKILISKNHEKPGAGNSRNAALSISKGELIAFLDADDVWSKYKIQKQINLWEKGYNFISTSYSYENTFLKADPPSFLFSKKQLFLSWKPIGTSTVLLDFNLIKNEKFSNIEFCQDLLFWAKVFEKEVKYYGLEESLVTYSMDGRTSRSNYFERGKFFLLSMSMAKLPFTFQVFALISYVSRGIYRKIFLVSLSRFLKILRSFY